MTGQSHSVLPSLPVTALALLVLLTSACDGTPWSSDPPPPDPEPVVEIEEGELRGRYENGVNMFLGIPYARPPVRSLRWRPPEPPERWGGVRRVQAFGADCMQHATPTQQPQSEDCLFLNVWAPAAPEPPASVMVWIHGGGLTSGSSANPTYDGAAIARRGVVVVSFNYRLGRFGYFAHPALTADDREGLVGNYGLMDQMAALLWVQRNIAAFGGNASDITVFGESAGGRSVHALLTSPLSTDLFHKAIIQSGAGRPRMRPMRAPREETTDTDTDPEATIASDAPAETLGVVFAESVGLQEPNAAELRALPALLVRGPKGESPTSFPDLMIDGQILRSNVDEAYQTGRQAQVPVIIGANSLEALSGDAPLVGDAGLFDALGEVADEARALYDGYGTDNDALIALEMEGDRRQVSGTRRHARLLAPANPPVYLYHYSYITDVRRPQDPGARHGSELPLLFGTLHTTGTPAGADTQVTDLLASYWVQFAKTGDPNADGRPRWPAYQEETDELLEFTELGTAAVRARFERAKLDFWDRLEAAGWSYAPGRETGTTSASAQTSSSNPQ